MEGILSSMVRLGLESPLLPAHEERMGNTQEEERLYSSVLPRGIYIPRFPYANEGEKELYRYVRGREWRLLQEGEVWANIRKAIPAPQQMPQKVLFPLRPYIEPSPRVLVEELGLRYREHATHFFKISFVSSHSKDRFLHNVLQVPLHGKMQGVVYFCALESHKSPECVQFLERHFERLLVQALCSMPEPDEALQWDKKECVYEEELAHARRSEEGFLWNTLSLLPVKLQESWIAYATAHRRERGFDRSSGAGLCLVLLIGNILWCVNLGNSQAYLFQETRGQMWPLSSPSAKGVSRHRGTLCTDQALGHMSLPGLSSRPEISFFPREPGVPLTLVLGDPTMWNGCPPRSFWEFLSCDLGGQFERERLEELVSCVTGYARMNGSFAPSVLIVRIV